jgi:outer membrane protein assembly factor BamB
MPPYVTRNANLTRIAAERFTSEEGVKGWKVEIPGGIPGNQRMTTPAVADGKLFVGGGIFGHELYAIDAEKGDLLWRHTTADPGPTAPVVSEGYVTYNTESCTLEVLTTTGKPVWKKLLGSALLTMPAVDDGRLIASFPDKRGKQYHLASFALKTGQELWRTPIAGEIIAAPVIEGRNVLAATVGGTLYCFNSDSGELVWVEKEQNATSSPTLWNGHCWFSRRLEEIASSAGPHTAQQTEHVARRELDADGVVYDLAVTSRPADYLDFAKGRGIPPYKVRQLTSARRGAGAASSGSRAGASATGSDQGPLYFSDASSGSSRRTTIGVTGKSPEVNLGLFGLTGVWSYQGSRPLFYEGRLYTAMGDSLLCVDPVAEKVLWKKDLRGAASAEPPSRLQKLPPPFQLSAPPVTQPVLVNHKVFVGTSYGEIVCFAATDGKMLWKATVGSPVEGQLIVAGGRVYAVTSSGTLYCLETGDPKDDGWPMWGGNAAHTGRGNFLPQDSIPIEGKKMKEASHELERQILGNRYGSGRHDRLLNTLMGG